jgi:hypothetical protein
MQPPTHEIGEPQQIVNPKVRPAAPDGEDWIRRQPIRPTHRNGSEGSVWRLHRDTLFAPQLLGDDQWQTSAVEWMKGMRDLNVWWIDGIDRSRQLWRNPKPR